MQNVGNEMHKSATHILLIDSGFQVKPRDKVGVLGYPSNYRVRRNGDGSTAQTVFLFLSSLEN